MGGAMTPSNALPTRFQRGFQHPSNAVPTPFQGMGSLSPLYPRALEAPLSGAPRDPSQRQPWGREQEGFADLANFEPFFLMAESVAESLSAGHACAVAA